MSRPLRQAGSAPGRGATVELRDVTKRFSTRDGSGAAAVNQLSLAVMPGEICVLVGPSGCGKTTTLKMVNRLVEPTSGQILIDGQDITKMDAVALRRRIGYVIQQIGLFPHQTIAENVATVPRLLKWPEARIRWRVDDLLTLVGLDPEQMRGRYPAQLSGGERQRVGVARALAAEPPLLLMDEPFGAVDPIIRERLQDEFLELQRRLGTTVLFVTHDVDEALKLGSRVAVMAQGGRLAQCSPPTDLLARPADDYVARFLGVDRSLKWLALTMVGDVEIERRTPPVPALPRLNSRMTLREALSILLLLEGQQGTVFDDSGAYVGVLTIDAIGAALRAAEFPGGVPGAERALGPSQTQRSLDNAGPAIGRQP